MTAIAEMILEGFRNFKLARINLTRKALVIGANDVGKSNLAYALRLLLDRTLSEADMEPADGDFYAHEDTNEFKITLKFTGVNEDCVLAKLKDYVSDNEELYLSYQGRRDDTTKQKSFSLYAGHCLKDLRELSGRHYVKVLNLRYIAGRRDLQLYLKRERRSLLEEARANRSEEDKTSDTVLHERISASLKDVSETIANLTYIRSATAGLNAELGQLSHHHASQEVAFDAVPGDPAEFVETVALVSKVQGRSIPLTGDGRANQVHLSLWAARNRTTAPGDLLEVSILCIEEPEAHLHPHQQRKLSSYLFEQFDGQVIVTTHSPQLACEFAPGSIVRLYPTKEGSRAAGDGCSKLIEDAIVSFGYRMGVIPAEAIFSSAAILVEGPSEEILLRSAAKEMGVDLDRLNISILSVNGISFRAYAELLHKLEIPFAARTDNDIAKIRKSNPDKYRMSGIERAWTLCTEFKPEFDKNHPNAQRQSELAGFPTKAPPDAVISLAGELRVVFAKVGIYISDIDIERDLFAVMPDELATHYGYEVKDKEDIIAEMKKAKAGGMFSFVQANRSALKKLAQDPILQPILYLQKKLEG